MKTKSFVRRPLPSPEMSLQITSMADVFTIILVFLLKSYATGAMAVAPSKDLTLPQARSADSSPVEALKVEVSEKSVAVEGQAASEIDGFAFKNGDLMANGASKSLVGVLEKERKRQLLIAGNNPRVKVDAKIMIVADQRAPYQTIKTVLASAALNGYTDFKLAVVHGD